MNETIESMAEPKSFPAGASNKGHEAAVDRLIELAMDKKSASATALVLGSPKATGQNPMWKILLQLKPLLPYLTRLLPLLEVAGMGQQQNAGLTRELRESLSSMQASHDDLRTAIDDQAFQSKQMEERLMRAHEAAEKRNIKLAEDIRSIGKQVRILGATVAVLLAILIVMTGVLLAHGLR